MPKVTYILPTIRKQWIDQTIKSVLAQTLEDWEMIILDKNHVIQNPIDKRITVIDMDRKSHCADINIARELAKSDIILHIFDDDIDLPHRAEFIYNTMTKDNLDVFIGSYWNMDVNGIVDGEVIVQPFNYDNYRLRGLNMPLFCSGYRNSTCPKWRKDFHLLADYCFFTDCHKRGLKIVTSKEILAKIRNHPGQVNQTDKNPEMQIFWDMERYRYCQLYGVDKICR